MVEAEHLAQITEQNTIVFVWKSIICRFRILQAIVIESNLTILALGDYVRVMELRISFLHQPTLELTRK